MLGLLELLLRDARRDDPRAGVDVRPAILEDGAPDRDRGVEVAVVAEVPDRPAVQAPALALGGRDQLHRPDLRRARERAGREDRPERVEGVEVRLQPALHVADEVQDVGVALHLHVLADRHRPGAGDPADVVAAEVHEHHVLGALLRVPLELLGEDRVLALVRAARPRARRWGAS